MAMTVEELAALGVPKLDDAAVENRSTLKPSQIAEIRIQGIIKDSGVTITRYVLGVNRASNKLVAYEDLRWNKRDDSMDQTGHLSGDLDIRDLISYRIVEDLTRGDV